MTLKSLPKDIISDYWYSKLKAFAEEKLIVTVMISLFDSVQNTVQKRENAGYQHFLLFPFCFLKPPLGLFKVRIVW